MSHYVGPTFIENCGNDQLILNITGRDGNNHSRIGRAHAVVKDKDVVIEKIEPDPIFDIGEIGQFDESGVSYPWIHESGDSKLMYYVGWVSGGIARFQNYTGLAISEDGGKNYRRYKKVPILDRTESEPYGSGSCAVYVRDGKLEMMYTAFEPWGMRHGRMQPSYNIKLAHSVHGLEWERKGEIAVDFEDSSEYVIGKPMPLYDEGVHKLWYSYRGESYRIGYAESLDGSLYQRKDDIAGLDVADNGWDSQMVEYSFVFRNGPDLFMVYNGNDFGRTGLGLAVQC